MDKSWKIPFRCSWHSSVWHCLHNLCLFHLDNQTGSCRHWFCNVCPKSLRSPPTDTVGSTALLFIFIKQPRKQCDIPGKRNKDKNLRLCRRQLSFFWIPIQIPGTTHYQAHFITSHRIYIFSLKHHWGGKKKRASCFSRCALHPYWERETWNKS